MPRSVLIVLVALLAAATAIAAGCGSDSAAGSTTTPQPTQANAPTPDIDEAAVLKSLQMYARAYDAGDYAVATRYLSDRAVDACGGPLATALALSQIHKTDGIDFRVTRVKSWADGSRMADVRLVERIEGSEVPTELGLGPFIQQRGRWAMDDEKFYPVGAGAFCE